MLVLDGLKEQMQDLWEGRTSEHHTKHVIQVCREMPWNCPSWANEQWAKFHLTAWEQISHTFCGYWCCWLQGQIWSSVSREEKVLHRDRLTGLGNLSSFIFIQGIKPCWFLGGTGKLKYRDAPNKQFASEIAPCPRCQLFVGLPLNSQRNTFPFLHYF